GDWSSDVCSSDLFGTNGVAIAFVADKFQLKPMVLRGRFVAHDVDRAVVGGNDGVETAVVIDVANGHAAAQPRLAENDARCSGNVDELFAGVAQKKHGFAVMEIGIADLDGVKIVA